MKRLFAIRHLVVLAVAAATTLMVSCFKDDIIELPSGKPFQPTASEYITFQVDAQWADEDVISRNAATRNRVGKHDLISEDGELSLPMGVYVEEGICGTTDNGKTRGAVLDAIGNSFTVWASLTNGGTTELFFPGAGQVFTNNDNTTYKSDPAYFWPGAGTFSFTAVANAPENGFVPNLNTAGTALESFTYTVPTDATAQNDIVLATLKDVNGDANATQAHNFDHILSAVQFKVGETMAAGVIKSIKLNNIKTTGTYNVIAGTWTADTSKKGSYSVSFSATDGNGNYEPNDKANGTIINDDECTFMMLPQVLDADAEVVVEFIYDNAQNAVKELRANIAMKENTTARNEWKAATTTYYELSVDENYNLTITPKGDILDAHYVMTDVTVNIDTETDQAWTLTVEATNISGDNVSIEYKDNLKYFITQEGYWIDKIIDGTTTTSARGDQTVTGTTKGAHTITVFIPENITAEERKITLTLKLDNVENAVKTEYLYQMCPYWDTDKGFGWEKVENEETGEYGFNWNRVVCYIYKYNFLTTSSGDYKNFNTVVDNLINTYNASAYVTKKYYPVPNALGIFGDTEHRGAVIIDYTKVPASQIAEFYDLNNGLINTQGFFNVSNVFAFETALKSTMKTESDKLNDPAFRMPDVNDSKEIGKTLQDYAGKSWGIDQWTDSPYEDKNGNKYDKTFNAGTTMDDMSGIINYIIKRNSFNVNRTTTSGLETFAVVMDPQKILWYLPAVNQYKDPVLSFATGNTTFTPANFWSSTACDDDNTRAYLGSGDKELRTVKKQVVVQRIVTPIPQAATVTVDNSSIAGGDNGSTNNWL